MASDKNEAQRERSAAVFGNRAVIEVVQAIERLATGSLGTVTTRSVASATRLSDSIVRPVMHRLDAAGAIKILPRGGGARSTRLFEVQRGPVWKGLVELCDTLAADIEPTAGGDSEGPQP